MDWKITLKYIRLFFFTEQNKWMNLTRSSKSECIESFENLSPKYLVNSDLLSQNFVYIL
jgi:hypothetical protein